MDISDRQATSTHHRSNLRELVNVGPAVERHLSRVGVMEPDDLVGRDPLDLFDALIAIDGRRHDPCLLDTFMSAVDQAEGRPGRPWWHYTAERKRLQTSRS
jgi:hypothetical protein